MRHVFTITAILGLCFATSAPAQQDFLEDGGGVRTGYEIGLDTQDDFLAGGGGISDDDTVTLTSEDEEFLEDGGGVSGGPQLFTSEREEFLEDGGGISSEIRVSPRGLFRILGKRAQRGWRLSETPRVWTSGEGSVLYVSTGSSSFKSPTNRIRLSEARAGRYANPGPKVIDIEEARLDKRPYPKSGLDIIVTGGGSKIIRIAPGY
ncbi:hypothetical protein FP2506_01435 [Fulvimarina pelagi HTCC2506]|uniref:Uncharacterized protein n=1 Tax=Fulvimarina pelagi HTCC2506 TaxID=314231 RepID=Q0G210_9HYPH|nr:hypothetical protein [Fulvimarina pelagi]EAU41388.1 hypothetical protein FP2506_01435 [Fulvimarina pelagi HTCC2506]